MGWQRNSKVDWFLKRRNNLKREISGVLPVILMPYNNDSSIDEGDFKRQVDFLVEENCNGFVIGQVSELLRLTTEERYQVAELSAKSADGRCLCIMSTGGESIKSAINFSQHAENVGVDALLVMHPTIMALNNDEMYRYFSDIIESVSIPVMIHHAKSLVKNPLSIEVQAKLLHNFGSERVMFKPEASPTPPRVSQLRDATNGKAKIFEGDGGMMLLDCYKRKLTGTIPATETAEIVHALWNYLNSNDEINARKIAHPLTYLMCQMMNSIDCYATIAKFFLKKRGLINNTYVRPPLDYHVDIESLKEAEETYDYLLNILKEIKK